MQALKKIGRYAMHRVREIRLYGSLLRRGQKRTIVFFQPHGRFGGSLFRAYEVAAGLNRRGWCAVVVPEQLELSQRQRVLRIFAPDIVLLHKSRDARNSHELLRDYPYVYDLDDADFHSTKLVERMEKDVAAAIGVIAGSRYTENWCKQFNANTTVIWTGSNPTPTFKRPHKERGRIVTWAQSAPTDYPVEFDFIVTVMEGLSAQFSDLTLRLYGDAETKDKGRSAKLRALGIHIEWMPFMKYDDYVASLTDVAVGFSPICTQTPFSRGKSFGKVLAYLDAMVPVVTSDAGDHDVFFDAGSGIVSNDPDVWIKETAKLLNSFEMRDAMAHKAHETYLQQLTLDVAVQKVEKFLLDCLDRT